MSDSESETATTAQDLALLKLYQHLKSGSTTPVRDLSQDDRRDYMRQKKRESRAAERAAQQDGRLTLNAKTIDRALADAAIQMLADGGPGTDRIREVLHTIFSQLPVATMTIEKRVRTGRIRPKFYRPKG